VSIALIRSIVSPIFGHINFFFLHITAVIPLSRGYPHRRIAKNCLSRAALTEEFASTAKTTPTPARAAETISSALPSGARVVVNSQSSPVSTLKMWDIMGI
jgi:hypothetical protein